MNKIIKSMVGDTLYNIYYKKYLNIGFEQIIFELGNEKFISLKSEDKKFPLIESHCLIMSNVNDIYYDYDKIEVNLSINEAILFCRDEWIMPGDPDDGFIGKIQHKHAHGPVGSAPKEAGAVITIDAGLLLNLGERRQRVLCYISSFPMLVEYSVDETEIVKLLNNCSIY